MTQRILFMTLYGIDDSPIALIYLGRSLMFFIKSQFLSLGNIMSMTVRRIRGKKSQASSSQQATKLSKSRELHRSNKHGALSEGLCHQLSADY